MVSLGKLGVVHDAEVVEEETTFDWFGTAVRLPVLEVSELELVDLMEMTTTTNDDDPSAIVVIKKMFRQVIHPDDFDLFWSLAKQNRQQIADLMPVYQVLLEAATTRPTRQPSDSSPGRPATLEASPPISSSEVVSPGRPDLVLLLEGGRETRAELAARMAAAV